MSAPRALVIGGSLAGLFAVHLLRHAGWEAVVFERSSEDLASRGAGIGTHEELFDVMREIRVPVDPSIGVHVEERICLDARGNVVHRVAQPQTMSAWARIYRPLREALPADAYRPGMQLERFEDDAGGVTAHFTNGARDRGDLLIGADGIRSTVRAQLMPEVQPRYAGYVAWRGMLAESALPSSAHALLFGRYAFCLPAGEMMLVYPVPGANDDTRPGFRAANFVWYRPTDPERSLPDLCTDASGHCHGIAIAPPLIRPEVIARIKRDAHALLAPQIAEIVDRVRPFFQPIFDVHSPRIVHGRVLLLGDAAFVARPHVGAGITKAALDAKCLADRLRAQPGSLSAALDAYDRERQRFGTRLVERGRRLGAYLEAQLKPPESRTAAELDQRPEMVLREIGAPLAGISELVAPAR